MVTSLGIDIGDTTGFLIAAWAPGHRRAVRVQAFQCDRESAPDLLGWILAGYGEVVRFGQGEEFRDALPGRKLQGTRPAPIRAQQHELAAVAARYGLVLAWRPAANVKSWVQARDWARLKAAGLWDITAGQPHARSAAWHCLYAAVHDGGLPDPLSRRVAGMARGEVG